VVLTFSKRGGGIKVYYRYTFTKEQGKKLIAKSFNKEYGFEDTHYVEMKIEEIKQKKTL
jgi:hypothetical protein